jgi:dCMP deaminase
MDRRPSWDQYFMLLAEQAAKRSTCSRLHVGAVVVQDYTVVGTGYNGAPSNFPHCEHFDDSPCRISVHAEANALLHSRMYDGTTMVSKMYCTHMPCFECSKLILNTAITVVYYGTEYRSNDGYDLLTSGGVHVVHVP